MSEPPTPNEFPTADTVPFPFESPYDVQRDLMAAILDSLRQYRDAQATSVGVDDYGYGGTDAAVEIGEPNTKRAPIIMLESPTGTGKSLSLACASMAWLKYCERDDIDKLMVPPDATSDKSTDAMVDSVNSANDIKVDSEACAPRSSLNKTKKYDWIEAWQPAEQNSTVHHPPKASSDRTLSERSSNSIYSQSRVTHQHDDRVRSFAIENRAALESELAKLRARLDRLDCIASSESTASLNDRREKERTLRENLVRSGVASALTNERKLNRQLARYRGENPGQNKKRRKIVSREDDQFLLETYHSDDDGRHEDNSIDSDEDDEVALVDLRRSNDDRNKQGVNRVGAPILSSRALLEGSNLDGSGCQYDPEKNARHNKSWEKSTTKQLAVGGVKAGTGLRKIVYAARTHSQLSQFIGELKRTHWGNDVKVVTLGSRSLLCSNEHVLYSSKSNEMKIRRGEAEITEMCLDMQKKKTTSHPNEGADNSISANQKSSCPYMASSEAISTLALHSLARPCDVEDLARLGTASHTCSYYASRQALAAAEVVVIPYNILLSPQARKSVGLSIRNALVVIDEVSSTSDLSSPWERESVTSFSMARDVMHVKSTQFLASSILTSICV
jgi:hypothetical protein